jgi:hypothetical protein
MSAQGRNDSFHHDQLTRVRIQPGGEQHAAQRTTAKAKTLIKEKTP